jgi:hypothetical protein
LDIICDLDNTKIRRIMYYPQECSGHPGFFKIPGLDHHVINASGTIMNLKTGTHLAKNVNASGYAWSSMRGEPMHCVRIHRALALAMLPHPKNTDDLVVNHIDGNKLNNSLTNLEWCSHRYNCEHAGENGLTAKCCPIQCREFKSGTVFNFPSQMACAEYYEYPYIDIVTKIRYGFDGARVWPDGRQYRRRSDKPWPDPIQNDDIPRKKCDSFTLRKCDSTHGRSVEVDMHDLKTGEYIHFPKISDVATFFNISLTTAWSWLCKNDQPIVYGRYHMKLMADTDWKTPGDLILEDSTVRGYMPIQVYNPTTGETRVFESSRVCSKYMNVKTGALFERIKSNRISPDGWFYCKYPMSDKSVPFERLET